MVPALPRSLPRTLHAPQKSPEWGVSDPRGVVQGGSRHPTSPLEGQWRQWDVKKKFYFIVLGCFYKATFMQVHNGLKSHSPHPLLTHSPVPLVSFVPLQLRWFPWQLCVHNRVSIKHGVLRWGNIGDTCLCTCKQLNHLRDRGGGRSKRERE